MVLDKEKEEDKIRIMSLGLERSKLFASISSGDLGMMLEHLADIDPTPDEIIQAIADALEIRSEQKAAEAERVGSYRIINVWGQELVGGGSFERNRSQKLKNLADIIRSL